MTLSLTIAGLEIQVHVDEALARLLRDRFEPFRIAQPLKPFELEVKISRLPLTAERAAPRIVRDGSSFEIVQPGSYVCFGQLDRGRATLQIDVRIENKEEQVRESLKALVSFLLAQQGGWLSHAAAIAHRGSALLVLGLPRTGKSTLCSFFPDDWVLNDDIVAIKHNGSEWSVYATPFGSSETLRHKPQRATIVRLALLEQSSELALLPMSKKGMVRWLLDRGGVPAGAGDAEEARVFDGCVDLVQCCESSLLKFPHDAKRVSGFLLAEVWGETLNESGADGAVLGGPAESLWRQER